MLHGKLERQSQTQDRLAKLGAVRAIPGDDAVEASQPFHQPRRLGELQHVQPGRSDRVDRIGEADQRDIALRYPDFQIIGAQRFQRGQRNDQVAYRARPDQQTAHQPAGRILEMSLYNAKTITTMRNTNPTLITASFTGMLRSRPISISTSSSRITPPSKIGIGSMLTMARFRLRIAIRS